MKAIPTPFSATGSSISGTALSEHDDLPLPGNRRIGKIESAELTRLLQTYGIPGVSANNPRDANLKAYAAHLAAVHKSAGDQALAEWLTAKSQ